MEHNPKRVEEKISQLDNERDWNGLPPEAPGKILTTLLGYDPRAKLLTIFVLHNDRAMHQEELMARADIDGLDVFEEAITDLLCLNVIEVSRANNGIPYYILNPLSGAGGAICGANESLVENQIRQISERNTDN